MVEGNDGCGGWNLNNGAGVGGIVIIVVRAKRGKRRNDGQFGWDEGWLYAFRRSCGGGERRCSRLRAHVAFFEVGGPVITQVAGAQTILGLLLLEKYLHIMLAAKKNHATANTRKTHIGVGGVFLFASLDVGSHFLRRFAGALLVIRADVIGNNAARSNKLAALKSAIDM